MGDGVEIEFARLSDTQFVMSSDVSTLDEQAVESDASRTAAWCFALRRPVGY